MIKYFYIRQPNTVENVNYYTTFDDGHLYQAQRLMRGAPIACIAYERRKDEDLGEGWDLVTYALSAANSEKDEFKKREGSDLAFERLTGTRLDRGVKSEKKEEKDVATVANFPGSKLNQAYCFNVDRKLSSNEVLKFILDEVASNSDVPSRAHRAAKRWVDGGDAL